MLSGDEQRALAELERQFTAEADGSSGSTAFQRQRRDRHRSAARAMVVVGWIAALLAIAGAVVAGLALAAATALGWLLWRYWPQLSDDGAMAVDTRVNDGDAASRTARRRPGGEWLSHYFKRISEAE